MTRNSWIRLLIGISGLVPGSLGTRTARAELLYFSRGGAVQLPASIEGESVRLEAPGGPWTFLKRDFRKMVTGHCPDREWPSRRQSALSSSGLAPRASAAWWALENGLTSEAIEMIREATHVGRSDPTTSRMASALLRLEKPCSDPDVAPLREALGGNAKEARSPHVLLLHQHPEDEGEERVALLERVVLTYYLMLAAQGIELPVPDKRLPSAYFAGHRDYLAFLRSVDAGMFESTQGYYHPTLRAVVAYDLRSSSKHVQARGSLAARNRDLDVLEESIRSMSSAARTRFDVRGEPSRTLARGEAAEWLSDLRRDLSRRGLLLELEWRAMDHGTAAHEMIHLLVAESGLAPHHDDFPLWLHEGFAAQFEVIRGGRWAGFGRAHDLRLPDWRSLQPTPRLVPLVQDTRFGRGYRRDLYAQAWSLVYYLRKEHPQEFLAFLDRLRAPKPDIPSNVDRAFDAFRDSFGDDTLELEASWHRYLRSVHTPLDDGNTAGAAHPPQSHARRD